MIAASVFAVENHPGYPLLPLEEMRISVYTKAFAERFGLPAPAPGTEPDGGLEAIEFAIEKGRFAPYYYLNIYLYVDSSLPIKYPEEGVAGEKYMLIKGTHFFGRSHDMWMSWPEEDRLHFNERQGSYHRKANLATMDYIPGKKGATTSLYYREFHKDILPGLAYIKLDCSPPSVMIDRPIINVGIWLQVESQVDYRSRIEIDTDDFLKFAIPDGVFKEVRKQSLRARKANETMDILMREPKQAVK
ncbi:hypothetical protein [Pelovirga terrestris]|uniref:Uncharacterized protein n=1 Tax=Pelovirga terrestris TaxID=2771352 RepID=A0A8J6ULE6_9BACT|nr:hypothetical protein [Pelovirga terrestris]MBD1401027.1 hypothetical protein [Pelovirga terrestris]